jgi:hypothetical protein
LNKNIQVAAVCDNHGPDAFNMFFNTGITHCINLPIFSKLFLPNVDNNISNEYVIAVLE